MNAKIIVFLAMSTALVACAPVAEPVAPVNPVSASPMAVTPATGIAGLQERAPDLCKAKQYVPYLGQPGSMIAGLGITQQFRVVEHRGIEPQEYDPNRIVFRLDASGNIYNIDCG